MVHPRSRPAGTGPPRSPARTWHRILGLTGAAFLLLLVITGILLQHPDGLGLDRRFASAPSLLRWYGIDAPDVGVVYADERAIYAQLAGRTFRDAQPLDEVEGELRGVASVAGLGLVATDAGVWLYDPEGRFVDRFDAPGMAIRLGRVGDDVVLESDRGRYRADPSLIEWRASAIVPRLWSTPRPASAEEVRALQASYLAQVLSWERVLLDLHSGRLFGPAGPFLIDAGALVLLVTALTGLFLALGPRGSQNP